MFKALKAGQVSRVIPVIGTLIPLILLGFALTNHSLKINEIWGVGILVGGLVVLTLPEWRGRVGKQELVSETISAGLFAVSYILLRQAYLGDNFLTVFTWSRLILIPMGVLLVAIPYSRQIVFAKHRGAVELWRKHGGLFLLGQAAGGASELLLTFSVSLANPALVNSLQGVQYAFLFIIGLILGKKYPKIYQERLSQKTIVGKILGVLLIAFGLYVLAFSTLAEKTVMLGVTYSPKYAASLGLEPTVTFDQMLADLNVKRIRLPVYWDQIEEVPGVYDFSAVDYYVNQAQNNDVEIIMALGYKQPRWPECFAPDWAKNLNIEEKGPKILELIKQEVEHFKLSQAVVAWQVENESDLSFGLCEMRGKEAADLFKQEVALVRSLDSRPIMLTDSGELTSWIPIIKLSDWFGVSLYRTVWNPWFGLVDYPLAPAFYQMKMQLAEILSGTFPQKTLISELQAEPWATAGKPLVETALADQINNFKPDRIAANVSFAKETGFDEIYLWGVEWWYFMDLRGHPEYLEQAKLLFNSKL